MDITHHQFRELLGSFASGVTVVTSFDKRNNAPYGVTISAFSSLSLDPPLIAFNLDNSSQGNAIFTHNQDFVINILSTSQQPLSQHFASSLKAEDWHNIPHTLNAQQIPLLTGSCAHIECTLSDKHQGGDHTIYIGRVIGGSSNKSASPLVYYHGNYFNLSNT